MRLIEELVNRQINRWNNIAQTLTYLPGEAAEPPVAPPDPAGGIEHPVVCISRDLGSGARHIALGLAQRLGYELIGSTLIDEIARDLKVQRSLISTLDERTRGSLEIQVESTLRGRQIDSADYLRSLVRVVKAIALNGGVVLLGRGGSFIVRERSALNVLVTAPLELRCRNLEASEQIDSKEALARIRQSDRDRRTFSSRLFDADIDDPTLYDLTINTERFTAEQAVGVILAAIEQRGRDLARMTIRLPSEQAPR